MNGQETSPKLSSLYDEDIDSYRSLFVDDYLNFGYWRGIDIAGLLTKKDRLFSEKELYRKALNELDVTKTDQVLEIGCGLGCGTALAFEEFRPSEVCGIDLLEQQIERAYSRNIDSVGRSEGHLVYHHGSATNVPYDSKYFNKVFSVEAIQHISDVALLADEVNRVIQRPGRIAFAAALAPSATSRIDDLRRLLGPFKPDSSQNHPVMELRRLFEERGAVDIHFESIGEDVWYGMDAWASRTEFANSSIRNWVTAYEQGLVDYYVMTANFGE